METLLGSYAKHSDPGDALFDLAQDCIDVIADQPGAELNVDKGQAEKIGLIAALLEINHTLVQIRDAVRDITPCGCQESGVAEP